MILALAFAVSLLLADAEPADVPSPGGQPPATATTPDAPSPDATAAVGEPLPPGAPTDSYELSAWCYGALDEYLTIYQKVKPDLRDIDHMFGTPVVEDEPYQSDMAAARVELKMIGGSVTEAEKASPRPISENGVAAIKLGRAIWSVAETKTTRELARAWMLWALPDRCDSNAKELTQRSILFGRALNYNTAPAQTDPAPAPAPAADAAQSSPDATLNAQAPSTANTSAPPSPTTDPAATPAAATPVAVAPDAPAPAATTDPAIPPYPSAQPAPAQPTPDQPTSTQPAPATQP